MPNALNPTIVIAMEATVLPVIRVVWLALDPSPPSVKPVTTIPTSSWVMVVVCVMLAIMKIILIIVHYVILLAWPVPPLHHPAPPVTPLLIGSYRVQVAPALTSMLNLVGSVCLWEWYVEMAMYLVHRDVMIIIQYQGMGVPPVVPSNPLIPANKGTMAPPCAIIRKQSGWKYNP